MGNVAGSAQTRHETTCSGRRCDGLAGCCKADHDGLGCTNLEKAIFGESPGFPGGLLGINYCTCKTEEDCYGGLPCVAITILCAAMFDPCPSTGDTKFCVDLQALLDAIKP